MTFGFVITGKTRSDIADVLRYIAFDIAHLNKVADVKQLKMSGETVEVAYYETRPADGFTEAENAAATKAAIRSLYLSLVASGLAEADEDVRSGGDAGKDG